MDFDVVVDVDDVEDDEIVVVARLASNICEDDVIMCVTEAPSSVYLEKKREKRKEKKKKRDKYCLREPFWNRGPSNHGLQQNLLLEISPWSYPSYHKVQNHLMRIKTKL